ncbi:MAG: type 1 glutamine amidotransferase domain-containing protein [Leptospira sp.]|nr:type 1 glutamine amidotransferase domain-containing protein [Leptospira sp.]
MKFTKFKILFLSIFFLGIQFPLLAKPKILVVVSAADWLELDSNPKYPTGVFLNELYHPVKALEEKGFEIIYASPKGKRATLDPESLKSKYWKSDSEREFAQKKILSDPSYLNPLSLEQIKGDNKNYVALMVPGGQGLMSDLLRDPLIPNLFEDFHRDNRPIGLICHAPALLISLPSSNNGGGFLFSGYRFNSVTKIEEWFIETFVMKGTPKVRKISNLLKDRGMIYESSFLPGGGYATRDRNLITSQNPFSGEAFNELFLQAVNEEKEKRGL